MSGRVLCILLVGAVACGGPGAAERDPFAEPYISQLEAGARVANGVLYGHARVEAPSGYDVEDCRLVIEWEGRAARGVTEPLSPTEAFSPRDAVWRFSVDVPADELVVAMTGQVTCGDLVQPLSQSYAWNETAREAVLARYCALCPDRSHESSVDVSTYDYGLDVIARAGVALRVEEHRAVVDACDGAVLIVLGRGVEASPYMGANERESRLIHLADHGEAVCDQTANGIHVTPSTPERGAEIVEQLRASGRVATIRTSSPPPP